MKFISPGGWFSLEYPATWSEFGDSEEIFLFYDPNKWSGNFRISAYKGDSPTYARQCMEWEMREHAISVILKLGEWECAYCAESFIEDEEWYTTHIWVTGKGNVSIECSFTVKKGSDKKPAEDIIRSLKLRTGNEEKEAIPVRVMEIGAIDEAFDWVSTTVKKTQTTDFTSRASDIKKLQKLVDDGKLKKDQKSAWTNIGLALGTIIENEMDGMQWVTVVDGKKEYPALKFDSLLIDPAYLVWNLVKDGRPCNLQAEFDAIRQQVEDLLNA